ncbi:MAG: DegV family protein [Lachnospira sp.]|nr:DegV family protein [Lachnospira sp.]
MIQIITDSTCDINKEEAAALGIHIVPLTVRFGNEEYLDGFTLSNEEFYQKLESCEELPVTSQPSPIIFKDLFMKYTEVGDQILGIFISSQLSGTFQSASIAAEMVRDECPAACIELIDSKSVSIGTSLLIREALRMRSQGLFLDQMVHSCLEMADHIRVYAMAGSLKYLQKGGRLSSSAALVGSLLKITPVIEIVDGTVQIACKARGKKSAATFIFEQLETSSLVEDSTFVYGHANAKESLQSFVERTHSSVNLVHAYTGNIGCVVGTHIGPGSFGVAYLEEASCEAQNELAS